MKHFFLLLTVVFCIPACSQQNTHTDIIGSYRCQDTHLKSEYLVFVKPMTKSKNYQVLYEIANNGKYHGILSATQKPNYYLLKWESDADAKRSGIARWKFLPKQDGAIKARYLGFDPKTNLIDEGKLFCKPVYD